MGSGWIFHNKNFSNGSKLFGKHNKLDICILCFEECLDRFAGSALKNLGFPSFGLVFYFIFFPLKAMMTS
jgi:hypothetical protein